jgi:4-hydroxybenzoate polyprenyltransferase/phosphoglycolate phosphatase-like HAD superfamily hydrolase
MSVAAVSISHRRHIVVDLDGTLVLTDTFAASLLEAVRKRPSCIFGLIAALLRGRAICKNIAAEIARLNIASLPYHEPLIEYLKQERAAGHRLILATGADLSIANAVAEHLGIFDDVIASDGARNMTGDEKLRAIREKLGDMPFTYAGNSRADLKVWRRSQAAILVGAPRSCARELHNAGISVQQEFKGAHRDWKSLVRCMRPHQWSKNVLVFVPAVLAHQVRNGLVMRETLIAFFALSFCASALYIVNDLLDLQADRLHPRKRNRPLASGEVSVEASLGLAVLLALTAAALGTLLPSQGFILLAGYAASSLLYSLKLKRMLFLDVVSLALLYALRVLYGGAATNIKISVWTLAFSLFLFASLATVKRLAELRRVNVNAARTQEYRGYMEVDVPQLSSLASAAGYVAVLVFALYINSPEVTLLYRRPQGLWLLCPILIYWISRLTLIANRGHLDDDPVAFALKDRATWFAGALAAVILVLST